MKIYIIKNSHKGRGIEESINMVAKIKKELYDEKTESGKIAKQILNKFDLDKDIIRGLPLSFSDDIDISAKTLDGIISLNKALLDKSFYIIMRYVIHELVHVCQHIAKEDRKAEKVDLDNYLNDDDEEEAFKWQISFQSETEGQEDVNEYIDELLEFHKFPKKNRSSKKKELKEYLGS